MRKFEVNLFAKSKYFFYLRALSTNIIVFLMTLSSSFHPSCLAFISQICRVLVARLRYWTRILKLRKSTRFLIFLSSMHNYLNRNMIVLKFGSLDVGSFLRCQILASKRISGYTLLFAHSLKFLLKVFLQERIC